MLLHINPTRQRGKRTGSLAGASGWYMTFFAAGVIRVGPHALAKGMLEGLPYVAILLLLLLLLLLLVLFLILLFIFLVLLCASRLSTRQSKVDGTLAPPRCVFFPRPSDVGLADTPCFPPFPARQASPTLGPNGSQDVPRGLTQNDIASFVAWSPQPSAVGPVPHQPEFLINLCP